MTTKASWTSETMQATLNVTTPGESMKINNSSLLYSYKLGGLLLPLSLVPLLCSQCSPDGLGCPKLSFNKKRLALQNKYLITVNNNKK
jgi:hypothetical protein